MKSQSTLKSQLNQWRYRSELYESKTQDKLTKDMIEWVVTYGGKNYTFVRREWVTESFRKMNMDVRDFDNWVQATIYLKKLFVDYAAQYPDLFTKEDWYRVDGSEIYPMINQWTKDNNIPYVGCQYSNGSQEWIDYELYVWLPVCIKDEFIYIWGISDVEVMNFYCRGKDVAHLSVLFRLIS